MLGLWEFFQGPQRKKNRHACRTIIIINVSCYVLTALSSIHGVFWGVFFCILEEGGKKGGALNAIREREERVVDGVCTTYIHT